MSGAADLVVCFMVLMDIENLDQTIAKSADPRPTWCVVRGDPASDLQQRLVR